MDYQEIDQTAATLVAEAAESCNLPTGFSPLSTTIYDTAWVSMVSKTVHEDARWLFPECFDFLLSRQTADGGWGSFVRKEDGIMNTMAAMLALKLHADAPQYSGCHLPTDVGARISKANAFLQRTLEEWKVEEIVNVGSEILIPSHLQLLQQRGFSYNFPCKETLMSLNRKKLAEFNPQMLYGSLETSLVHSLEAFVGMIDFDKVSHHRRGGSMMGSPSSTAAFLMYSSSWYEDVEEFLSTVVSEARGLESGGVPTVFPATNFMLSWATSTLLGSGFSVEALGLASFQKISDFLDKQLLAGKGLVGFAPNYLADADDTAKTIVALNLLGRTVSPDAMGVAFEAQNHFITFPTERNPSFSTNCHVLMALLTVRDPKQYSFQIHKVASFLCDLWYQGEYLDKWNTCPQYPWMLLAQALVRLLHVWDTGEIDDSFTDLLRDRIPVVLCQILNWTMRSLESDQPCDRTAYAVLTLTSVSSIPWFKSVQPQIATAIQRGQNTITAALRQHMQPQRDWVGKVSYSSPFLSELYCLAALKSVPPRKAWGTSVESLANISEQSLTKFARFFLQLPLFSQESEWKIKASLIEGYLFYPQLERIRLNVYPQKDIKKDRTLEYNALVWAITNNFRDDQNPATIVWDMMVVSMLNYQTDEYMEAVVERGFADNLEPVKRFVHDLCDASNNMEVAKETNQNGQQVQSNGGESEHPKPTLWRDGAQPSKASSEVSKTLSNYARYLIEHRSVQRASVADRNNLILELRAYLLAHITQIEDNTRLKAQKSATTNHTTIFKSPKTSYYAWVQSISADHTSVPVAFAFLTCLIGARSGDHSRSDCFDGVQQKYYAQSLSHHLGIMCRQENDYGSMARDFEEGNLNSLNFPEFHHDTVARGVTDLDGRNGADDADETAGKMALVQLAAFEREVQSLAMRRLKEMVSSRVWRALVLYVDMTVVYGQIYAARDISNWVR